ncbi:MAG: hypothetical protein NTY86_01730 [Deltaproteobacteria bacterium]|nr:hypothetical protein [Deltaproteobacteria bacterium]
MGAALDKGQGCLTQRAGQAVKPLTCSLGGVDGSPGFDQVDGIAWVQPESNKEAVMRVSLATAWPVMFVCSILCYPALAQEARVVQEPEYLSTFFVLDSNTGHLRPLERQSATRKIQVKAFGFAGAEGWYELNGARSSVRFPERQALEFVVLVTSQKTDPQTVLRFFSLNTTDDTRRLPIDKAGPMGLGSTSLSQPHFVSYNASKYGASSFKLTSLAQLPPGEYALRVVGPGDIPWFCFGVDPPTPVATTAPPQ